MVILLAPALLVITAQVLNQFVVTGLFFSTWVVHLLPVSFLPVHSPWNRIFFFLLIIRHSICYDFGPFSLITGFLKLEGGWSSSVISVVPPGHDQRSVIVYSFF